MHISKSLNLPNLLVGPENALFRFLRSSSILILKRSFSLELISHSRSFFSRISSGSFSPSLRQIVDVWSPCRDHLGQGRTIHLWSMPSIMPARRRVFGSHRSVPSFSGWTSRENQPSGGEFGRISLGVCKSEIIYDYA